MATGTCCSDPVAIWTALATVTTAVAALVVAIYQAGAIRQHNRLSSMPLPTVDVEWFDENPKLRITLINKGIGPALLLPTVSAFLDGQPQPFSSDQHFAKLLASTDLRKATLRVTAGQPSVIPDGRAYEHAIAPGDRFVFLEVSCDLSKTDLYARLRRVAFRFEFESAYRERFVERLDLERLGPGEDVELPFTVIRPLPPAP